MKLSQYARATGLSYPTVLRMFHRGELSGRQLPSGTILVDDPNTNTVDVNNSIRSAACYARVSSAQNKANLDTQSNRIEEFCVASGLRVVKSVKEVGSGLNDNRPKLLQLLNNREYDVLVVEHADRLTRFGRPYIEAYLTATNRSLLVINTASDDKFDLMEDFVSLVTSFCAHIYGQRRSLRKTERIVAELNKGVSSSDE